MLSSLISNGQPQTPAPLEVMVPWWSFTKTVLAATALSLVRDGLSRLDDPLLDQPYTRYAGTQAAGQAVSLRSIVCSMATHQRAVLLLKRTPMKVPSKPRLSHS